MSDSNDNVINFNERKKDFKGIEFNLEDSKDPDLFIISKSKRNNSNEIILISYYYIFRGNIYQSPNLFSILTSNVESITNNINNLILRKSKNLIQKVNVNPNIQYSIN